jgi:hypothetical protein
MIDWRPVLCFFDLPSGPLAFPALPKPPSRSTHTPIHPPRPYQVLEAAGKIMKKNGDAYLGADALLLAVVSWRGQEKSFRYSVLLHAR